LYVNDLYAAILRSNTYLFADDTGLVNCNNDLKTIEKYLKQDLRSIYIWLCSSCISLNVKKTEVMLFHHEKRKKVDHNITLKLNGKYLSISDVKYLRITIDKNLSFSDHINSLSIKLRNAN